MGENIYREGTYLKVVIGLQEIPLSTYRWVPFKCK